MTDLTHQKLLDLLTYNPETGEFFWRVKRSGTRGIGKLAGGLNGEGYWQICIDRKIYLCQRLAWYYVNGRWPTREIDHINRVRADNRIVNLREASKTENQINAKLLVTNTSGYRGVHFAEKCPLRPWKATITVAGKGKYLGHYHTKEAAFRAVQDALRSLHPDFVPSEPPSHSNK